MEEYKMDKPESIPALAHYPREEISTGTTLMAVEYAGGVVVGVDSRTSAGNFIASRATNKITPVNDHLVVMRAGSAADTQAVTDIAKYQIELFSTMENQPLSIYRATQILRSFLYDYREQLQASIIVAGYDTTLGGQIYGIPLGGFATRHSVYCSGSGGSFIHTFLDTNWKPNMSEQDAKDLIKQAVRLAHHRDGASGGLIRLAIVNEKGTQYELYRRDQPGFPDVPVPKFYATLPAHLEQHPL